MQNVNGRMNKNIDGLPMSLGQVQNEQIRLQWPRSIVEIDHLCHEQRPRAMHQAKSVGHAKARFTGIAYMVNSAFQGHYTPLNIDQQITSVNGQK